MSVSPKQILMLSSYRVIGILIVVSFASGFFVFNNSLLKTQLNTDSFLTENISSATCPALNLDPEMKHTVNALLTAIENQPEPTLKELAASQPVLDHQNFGIDENTDLTDAQTQQALLSSVKEKYGKNWDLDLLHFDEAQSVIPASSTTGIPEIFPEMTILTFQQFVPLSEKPSTLIPVDTGHVSLIIKNPVLQDDTLVDAYIPITTPVNAPELTTADILAPIKTSTAAQINASLAYNPGYPTNGLFYKVNFTPAPLPETELPSDGIVACVDSSQCNQELREMCVEGSCRAPADEGQACEPGNRNYDCAEGLVCSTLDKVCKKPISGDGCSSVTDCCAANVNGSQESCNLECREGLCREPLTTASTSSQGLRATYFNTPELSNTLIAQDPVPDPELRLWLKMDGDTTDNFAYNGTIDNFGADCTVPGKFDHGCSFNGTSSRLESSSMFNSAGTFTLAAWINPDGYNEISYNSGIIAKAGAKEGYNTLNKGIIFQLGSDGTDATKDILTFHYGDGMSWHTVSAPDMPLPLHEFHHVAVTVTDTTITLYIDGVVAVTAPKEAPTQESVLPVQYGNGYQSDYGRNYFHGVMDEIQIWNKALTQEELQTIITDRMLPLTTPPPVMPTYTRPDANLSFDWLEGAPFKDVPADDFSARWVGSIEPTQSEPYTFSLDVHADEGVRMWLNNVLIIDAWDANGNPGESVTLTSSVIPLVASQKYPMKVEYREHEADAKVQLSWESPSTPREAVPGTQVCPAQFDPVPSASSGPPVIIRQPQDRSVEEGDTAVFVVAADGTAPFTYQWHRNGEDIDGAMGFSYATSSPDDSGAKFSVTVSNAEGTVTSDEAVFTLELSPPRIVTQPENVTVHAGDDALFTVDTAGTNLSYQWKKNGNNIPGATDAIFALTGVSVDDTSDMYSVQVSNAGGSAESDKVKLTIVPEDTLLASDLLGQTVYIDAQTGEQIMTENNWKQVTYTTGYHAGFTVNPERQCETPKNWPPFGDYKDSETPYKTFGNECEPLVQATTIPEGVHSLVFPNLQVRSGDGGNVTSVPVWGKDFSQGPPCMCEASKCIAYEKEVNPEKYQACRNERSQHTVMSGDGPNLLCTGRCMEAYINMYCNNCAAGITWQVPCSSGPLYQPNQKLGITFTLKGKGTAQNQFQCDAITRWPWLHDEPVGTRRHLLAQENVFSALVNPGINIAAGQSYEDMRSIQKILLNTVFTSWGVPPYIPPSQEQLSQFKIRVNIFSSRKKLETSCGKISSLGCELFSEKSGAPHIINLSEDAALDNEIINHEFSHILLDYANPLLGKSELFEAGALQEGLADMFGLLLSQYPLKTECKQPGIECTTSGVDDSDLHFLGDYGYAKINTEPLSILQRLTATKNTPIKDTLAYQSFQTDATVENEGAKIATVLLKFNQYILTQIKDQTLREQTLLLYYQAIGKSVQQISEDLTKAQVKNEDGILVPDQHYPLIPRFYFLVLKNFKALMTNNPSANSVAVQLKEILLKDAQVGLVIGNSQWESQKDMLQWTKTCLPNWLTPIYQLKIPAYFGLTRLPTKLTVDFVDPTTVDTQNPSLGKTWLTVNSNLASAAIGRPTVGKYLTFTLNVPENSLDPYAQNNITNGADIRLTLRDSAGNASIVMLSNASEDENKPFFTPVSPYQCPQTPITVQTAHPNSLFTDTTIEHASKFQAGLSELTGEKVTDFSIIANPDRSIKGEDAIGKFIFDTEDSLKLIEMPLQASVGFETPELKKLQIFTPAYAQTVENESFLTKSVRSIINYFFPQYCSDASGNLLPEIIQQARDNLDAKALRCFNTDAKDELDPNSPAPHVQNYVCPAYWNDADKMPPDIEAEYEKTIAVAKETIEQLNKCAEMTLEEQIQNNCAKYKSLTKIEPIASMKTLIKYENHRRRFLIDSGRYPTACIMYDKAHQYGAYSEITQYLPDPTNIVDIALTLAVPEAKAGKLVARTEAQEVKALVKQQLNELAATEGRKAEEKAVKLIRDAINKSVETVMIKMRSALAAYRNALATESESEAILKKNKELESVLNKITVLNEQLTAGKLSPHEFVKQLQPLVDESKMLFNQIKKLANKENILVLANQTASEYAAGSAIPDKTGIAGGVANDLLDVTDNLPKSFLAEFELFSVEMEDLQSIYFAFQKLGGSNPNLIRTVGTILESLSLHDLDTFLRNRGEVIYSSAKALAEKEMANGTVRYYPTVAVTESFGLYSPSLGQISLEVIRDGSGTKVTYHVMKNGEIAIDATLKGTILEKIIMLHEATHKLGGSEFNAAILEYFYYHTELTAAERASLLSHKSPTIVNYANIMKSKPQQFLAKMAIIYEADGIKFFAKVPPNALAP